MNLENIQSGLRVPNYRKLCELLGETIEAGNSKKAQLRRWEQYFAYQKDKNAFIITEIYNAPKPSEDRRMKHSQNLIPLLCHHLALFGTTEQSFTSWFIALGMVDGSFYDKDRREDIRAFSALTPHQMQKLIYLTDSICKRTLMNTLASLNKEQIAAHSVNEYVVVNSSPRLATEEENLQIQHCKDQAMAAVGAASKFAIHVNPARRIRYYEILNEIYQQQHGWDRTYTVLKITPLDIAGISKYQNVDPTPLMEQLNKSIKETISSHLRNECEQAEQKLMEEWINDAESSGFKLDRMTAEMLIHVLENEL